MVVVVVVVTIFSDCFAPLQVLGEQQVAVVVLVGLFVFFSLVSHSLQSGNFDRVD